MQAAANAVQDSMGPEPSIIKATVNAKDGSTYRALVWHGNRKVSMESVPMPTITQDNDVILKVTGTTICGSDLHLYNAEILALKDGDILGHEFMGVVAEKGKNVNNLNIGQRVVVSFQVACGSCSYCKKKLSSFCDRTNDSSLMQTMYGARDAGFFGYSHFTGGIAGGQAEIVRVPMGNVNCLPIPDSVPDEQALYLSDVLPTSYHCVVDTGVKEGDVVCVWGLGPIGLTVCQFARMKGAKRVIGIDRVSSRLMKARELGFETVDFSKRSDLPKHLIEDVAPEGVDVALDCSTFHEPKTLLHKAEKLLMLETDVPEVANEMIVTVRKGGRCGVISAYAGITNHFNIGALMEKGIRFIGNGQAPVHLYWEELMEMLKDGTFDTSYMVSHRCDVEQFPELYDAFQKRLPGLEKVFVQTKYSSPPSKGYPQLSNVKDWPTKLADIAPQ